MTGDWVARPAEQADARASGAGAVAIQRAPAPAPPAPGSQGDPWTDDDLGATTQWARRDSGSQPQAQDGETGATTGRRRQDGRGPARGAARGAGDGVPALIERPRSRAGKRVWDSGPQQPVSATGSRPAASSGGQPRYAWDSGPQRRVAPTGSQPAVPGGDSRATRGRAVRSDPFPGPARSRPCRAATSRGLVAERSAAILPGPARSQPRRPAVSAFPWRSGPQRSVPRLARTGRAERRSAGDRGSGPRAPFLRLARSLPRRRATRLRNARRGSLPTGARTRAGGRPRTAVPQRTGTRARTGARVPSVRTQCTLRSRTRDWIRALARRVAARQVGARFAPGVQARQAGPLARCRRPIGR